MDCNVGKHLADPCSFTSVKGPIIPSNEVELISLRSVSSVMNNVCLKHYKQYIKMFIKLNQKSCCDPFSNHGTNRTNLSLEQHHYLKAKGLSFIPGKKLCTKCCIAVARFVEASERGNDSSSSCESSGLI